MVLVAIAALAWLLRASDPARVSAALRRADLRLVLLAVGTNLTVNLWARARRFGVLLGPFVTDGERLRTIDLAGAVAIGQAATNVLPGRVGEAVRTLAVRRLHGTSVSSIVAAQLVEKLVEVLSFALLATPFVLWGQGALFPSLARLLGLCVGIVFAGLSVLHAAAGGSLVGQRLRSTGLGVLGVLARISPRVAATTGSTLARLGDALARLGRPPTLARALAYSLVNDLADATMIGLCLMAVGTPLPFAAWFVVLLAVNFAIALPSTPAQLGVLEAGATAILVVLGVPKAEALAAALLYHACHFVPMTLLGLAFGARLSIGQGEGPNAPAKRP